jgi:hypothetical protein
MAVAFAAGAPVSGRARKNRGTLACLAIAAGSLLPALTSAATYTFIVAGLGGEPEYEKRFREQAVAVAAAAEKIAGDASHVVSLSGDAARRDAVRREMKAFAGRLGADDVVTIVLIGHGTFDGEEYRFNLPGPDLTATELLQLFDQLPARNQLIINSTSASGAAIERWQRPQRVIIAATKSGGERTATRFAEHWARAVTSDAADANKDEVVTAAEAFDYTSRQVAAAFKSDVALATEHARMEGDGAGRFTVARLGVAAVASTNPEVNALLARRGEIETNLDLVKARKGALSENEYYDALEGVLVQLALLQREIDAKQTVNVGGKP